MSFLGEIKRRKVFKVAAVYAVVAWLIIQVVGEVSEPLSLPDWLDTTVIVLLAVGFPIAIILAWAFDLTPQGVRSPADVQAGMVPTQSAAQWLSYISQALVLLAVGFLVADQYLFDDVRRGDIDAGSSQSAAQAVVRFAVVHSGAEPFNGASSDAKVAISPDGRHIAYLIGTRPSATLPLYVRALDRLKPNKLASSARSPFFSPDSQWVGFVEDNRQLSKVAITGGPSLPIGDIGGSVRGVTWTSGDMIIFGTNDSSTGLQRISAVGGDTEVLTIPDASKGEADHIFPAALPESRGVLFTITNSEQIDNSQIAVFDFETGEYRVLIWGGSYATYSESGHIVYGVAEALRAVPFDLESLTVSGDPVPVLDDVAADDSGSTAFSLSRNGTLVYLTGANLFLNVIPRKLVWVDRDGREEPLAADVQLYTDQRMSPDGQRVALAVVNDTEVDIWTYDLLRGTTSRLTFDRSVNTAPFWTPDGERVAFSTVGTIGRKGIYSKAADGTGQTETLVTAQGDDVLGNFFTQDQKWLITEQRADGIDIQAVSLMDGETKSLIGGPGDQKRPSLSPDGRWIAYESNENGRSEIYVRPFPDVDEGKWQISRSGGFQPLWGPDGREVFFVGLDAMMVIGIETEPTVSLSTPERLFPIAGYVDATVDRNYSDRTYSVTPDGQRFLMFKPATGTELGSIAQLSSLVVVQNWFEELTRAAPTLE
jgi:serine/threonine-protein kinase